MALSTAVAFGCGRGLDRSEEPDGEQTKQAADRYVRKAIRQSSEGVILLPSQKAERVYELRRLNEIAQNLRRPAAVCFINRAIETIAIEDGGAERKFSGVPEGQIKIRARIGPDGHVLRTEVLESGFADQSMEPCLQQAINKQNWPNNKGTHPQFIDVVYWVSLGPQEPPDAIALRKQQTIAGVRARNCLQGTVDAGTYAVRGINLMDRDGKTLVNRVEPSKLPEPATRCVALALRELEVAPAPETFVRPLIATVEFEVGRDGTVLVKDEDWLTLIRREERAKREADRAALRGDDHAASRAHGSVPDQSAVAGAEQEPEQTDPLAEPTPQRVDPGKSGLTLDLGTRPRREAD